MQIHIEMYVYTLLNVNPMMKRVRAHVLKGTFNFTEERSKTNGWTRKWWTMRGKMERQKKKRNTSLFIFIKYLGIDSCLSQCYCFHPSYKIVNKIFKKKVNRELQ